MKICDLHAHSTASDGSLTPGELLQLAVKTGLSAVVLSDHNTVAGLPEFVEAAKELPLEAVPGVEFTSEYEGIELHILGLYIQPAHYEKINALLDEFKHRKEESNQKLVAALEAAGYHANYGKFCDNHGYVNRAHIAQALVEAGHLESVEKAFKTLLKEGGGYYQPPKRLDAFHIIRFIKSMGAVAVLAHPLLNLDEQQLRTFLPLAKEAGLDGMETIYTKYSDEKTAVAKALAAEFGILESGGSDFHGDAKPDVSLGSGRGNLLIPLEYLENLKKRK